MNSNTATIIFVAIVTFLLSVVPLMKPVITQRLAVVMMITALLFAVVLHIGNLDDAGRTAVVVGGCIVGIVYMIIVCIEWWFSKKRRTLDKF